MSHARSESVTQVLVALLRPERRFGHRDARQSHAEPRRGLFAAHRLADAPMEA